MGTAVLRLGRQTISWLILAFLFLPILVVIPVSLGGSEFLELPHGPLSLRHYRNLVDDPIWLWSALNSLFVASLSSLLAVIVGGLCAFGCWQMTSRISGILRAIMLLPMIVPAVVCGLAFRRALAWSALFDSYAGVILTYVIVAMPYAFISVSASLALFDSRLLLAARSCGANRVQSIRKVLLPSIWPGILSGGLFAFIVGWDDIVILLFVTGRKVILLPRVLYEGLQDTINPSIAAVSSIMIVLTTVGVLVFGEYRTK